MADSTTTTYSFTLPEVGASADSWGTKLNANWSKVDDLFDGTVAVTGINLTTFKVDSVIVTASAAELNKLDGLTATTTELNYTDGVTSNIQTQLNGKATSAQGALADSAVQPDDNVSFGTGSFSGEIAANGGIALGDNDKATFGASDDLEIYHDGSQSRIVDTGTGNLKIQAQNFAVNNVADTENMITAEPDGFVKLFYNGSEKLATTSTGVDVTGTVTADGLTIGSGATFNGGDTTIDFSLGTGRFTTPNSFVFTVDDDNNTTTQAIYFRADSGKELVTLKENGDVLFFEDTGSTAKFVWDSSAEKLEVEGQIGITNFDALKLGTGHGGGASIAYSVDGNLKINPRSGYSSVFESGNVGIGTASPSSPSSFAKTAEISDASSASYSVNGAGTDAEMGASSGGAWLGTSNTSTNKNLRFVTNGSERARIDSSGNLLVGTTSDQTGSSTGSGGAYIGGAGSYLGLSRSNGVVQYSNRIGSDGDISVFRKDGSTVGSIGTSSNRLTIGTGDTGLIFSSLDYIRPWNVSTNSSKDASVALGGPGDRFKHLYLSDGVYLGGTGSANKLDDYEEGVWTPVINGSGGQVQTMTTQEGNYTKIGNKVTCWFKIQCSNDLTDPFYYILSGIPFGMDCTQYNSVGYASSHQASNTRGTTHMIHKYQGTSCFISRNFLATGESSGFANQDGMTGVIEFQTNS